MSAEEDILERFRFIFPLSRNSEPFETFPTLVAFFGCFVGDFISSLVDGPTLFLLLLRLLLLLLLRVSLRLDLRLVLAALPESP